MHAEEPSSFEVGCRLGGDVRDDVDGADRPGDSDGVDHEPGQLEHEQNNRDGTGRILNEVPDPPHDRPRPLHLDAELNTTTPA